VGEACFHASTTPAPRPSVTKIYGDDEIGKSGHPFRRTQPKFASTQMHLLNTGIWWADPGRAFLWHEVARA